MYKYIEKGNEAEQRKKKNQIGYSSGGLVADGTWSRPIETFN